VSTLSAAGVPNLAPHSFFTVASHEPPVLSFTSVGTKDSLRNVRETGEFVVCLAPGGLREGVNATSARFAPDQDEFAETALAAEPSHRVAPARVAGSPVAFECVLAGERSFAEGDRASTVVFGRVVHLAVDRAAMADDGLPDPVLLDPVARLGRDQWSTLGTVFELERPRRPRPA
jgi:flavin reductase (DIM6/NTAB) family NADH-FMN oxidoreductase RutF